MLQWDYFKLRCKALLGVSALSEEEESFLMENWKMGDTPELAADDLKLQWTGAYGSPDRETENHG